MLARIEYRDDWYSSLRFPCSIGGERETREEGKEEQGAKGKIEREGEGSEEEQERN